MPTSPWDAGLPRSCTDAFRSWGHLPPTLVRHTDAHGAGDAAAHLRPDDARGPGGAGLALETLRRESAPERAQRLPSEASRDSPRPRPQRAQAPDVTRARLSCSGSAVISRG